MDEEYLNNKEENNHYEYSNTMRTESKYNNIRVHISNDNPRLKAFFEDDHSLNQQEENEFLDGYEFSETVDYVNKLYDDLYFYTHNFNNKNIHDKHVPSATMANKHLYNNIIKYYYLFDEVLQKKCYEIIKNVLKEYDNGDIEKLIKSGKEGWIKLLKEEKYKKDEEIIKIVIMKFEGKGSKEIALALGKTWKNPANQINKKKKSAEEIAKKEGLNLPCWNTQKNQD